MNDTVLLFQDALKNIVDDYASVLGLHQRATIKRMFKYMQQNLNEDTEQLIIQLARFLFLNISGVYVPTDIEPAELFCVLLEQLHFSVANVLLVELATTKTMLQEDIGYIHLSRECFEPTSEFRVTARLVNSGFYNDMCSYLNNGFIIYREGDDNELYSIQSEPHED